MVINVEYNQLDPLLRATTFAEGDVNDESGFSPFPGNLNQVTTPPSLKRVRRTKEGDELGNFLCRIPSCGRFDCDIRFLGWCSWF